MDTVGVPVYTAVRPNSRSLSVSQGKGIDPDSAKVGAIMESVEAWHAERLSLPLVYESWATLRRSACVVDIDQLPARPGSSSDPSRPILWVEGRDLIEGEPIWVPYEAVTLNFVEPHGLSGTYARSSNGLASGNHMLEAIVHALYEVVERDAVALWEARGGLAGDDPLLDLTSVEDPGVASLVRRLSAAGVAVRVVEVTSDVGVPTYSCLIADSEPEQASWTLHGTFAGHGTHLDGTVALTRAMTEAIQSRLTHISGSRDDMFHYDAHANRDDARAAMQLFDRPKTAFEHADLSADSFEEDISTVLEALARTGIDRVIVVDLTRPEIGIPVVKVIVPGLEGNPHSASYVKGARAQSVGLT